MKRMQANLHYIAADAERHHKRPEQLPPGPALMTAPLQTPQLTDLYAKLATVFPGWKGRQEKQSPGLPSAHPSSAGATPTVSHMPRPLSATD